MAGKKSMTKRQIQSHFDKLSLKKWEKGERGANSEDEINYCLKVLSKPKFMADETKEEIEKRLRKNLKKEDGSFCYDVGRACEYFGETDKAIDAYAKNIGTAGSERLDIWEGPGESFTKPLKSLARLAKEDSSVYEKVYDILAKGGSGTHYPKEYAKNVVERMKELNEKDLTSRVVPVIAIIAIGAGMFFLSNSITGNAIADLSVKTTSWTIIPLMLIGLVASFIWMKRKK